MGRGKGSDASDFWVRYSYLAEKDLSIILSTGIKPSTLSSYKTGKRFPRADEAVKISRALGKTVEYLVTGESAAGWKPPERIARIVDDLMLLDDPGLEAVSVLSRGLASRIEHERRPSSGAG